MNENYDTKQRALAQRFCRQTRAWAAFRAALRGPVKEPPAYKSSPELHAIVARTEARQAAAAKKAA